LVREALLITASKMELVPDKALVFSSKAKRRRKEYDPEDVKTLRASVN
tara:strand:- start:511 stop:654 length:144 start_codon:yes stop_codon:yes gene_type:complete